MSSPAQAAPTTYRKPNSEPDRDHPRLTLQTVFTDRLIRRRQEESHRRLPQHPSGCCWPPPNTAAAAGRRGLRVDDLNPTLIGAFVDHLERDCGNTVRTAISSKLKTPLENAPSRLRMTIPRRDPPWDVSVHDPIEM
jgi:hypothetical protein